MSRSRRENGWNFYKVIDLFYYCITWFGSLLVLFPSAVAIAVIFRRIFDFSDIVLVLGGLLGASILSHILKIVIARPRPLVTGEMMVSMPSDFSFPSAHTAQAVAFFLSLTLVATRGVPLKSTFLVWGISCFLMLMVGVSRVYLKVHYVSDVVAGAALGVAWVLLLKWIINLFFTGGGHA